MNEPRPARLELATQRADVHLDDIVVIQLEAPDAGQQLTLGQHEPGVPAQGRQQAELRHRQFEELVAPLHGVGILIDDEIPEVENISTMTGAGQDGADTRHDLVDGEWFDDDVVGAGIERLHAVIEIVLGGEDDCDRIDDPQRADDVVRILMVDIDDGESGVEDAQQRFEITASLLGEHAEPEGAELRSDITTNVV